MTENAAAPATPSADAQPIAQPATDAAANAAPVTPAPKSVIRPIPSPRLPGVFPDGDPFPSPPSRSPDSGSPPSASSAHRGPDGRFVAGTSPAAAGGEHTLEPGQADDAATSQPPPAKFKFGGEEFESQSAAEQNFKTLRGQYRPVQTLARSLGGVDKIVPQFALAAESARSWKAEAERYRAELKTLQDGGAQPATASVDQSKSDDAESPADIDWEMYAELKKLASESGESWRAERWLIDEVRKADAGRMQKMLDERLAPLDEQQQQQAVVEQTGSLFESMAGYTDADGSPAFPELSNETASFEVGRLWASLGLPREAALTPQGAMAAIGLYRLAKGSQAKPAAVAAPQQVPAPAVAAPNDTESAAGLGNGQPIAMNAPGNGHAPSAEAARILAGLRQTNSGSRAALGFDA